jgi:hypothetical protein
MFMPSAEDEMTSRRNHRTTGGKAERPTRGRLEERDGIGCAYVKNFANDLVKHTNTDMKVKKISTKIALSRL